MLSNGFEKTAVTKWQKALPTLSAAAKGRLTRYAGKGSIAERRAAMMAPRHSAEELARHNRMDNLIYQQQLKHNPAIRTVSSKAMPYAQYEPYGGSHITMPKDPLKGRWTTANKEKVDLKGAEGGHRRRILEHEKTEYKVETGKAKHGPFGRRMRESKAIKENRDVVHSSAHPNIAEANIARRHPQNLKDLEAGWRETPAQGQQMRILKQHGWTPARGMPEFGRQAKGVQKATEKAFAPYLQKHVSSKLEHLGKRFSGSALKRRRGETIAEAKEFAGAEKFKK
jgi:hypothetical protein